MANNEPVTLFVSYAHNDEALKKSLDTHLSSLQRQRLIEKWSDREIKAGQQWAEQIDRNLKNADIILLLVSPDFVSSEYCSSIELNEAMRRHESGDSTVIPIILEPCFWDGCEFSKLQALPRNGRAVTAWPNKNEAFLDVIVGIRQTVTEVRKKLAEKQAAAQRYKTKVEGFLSDGEISPLEQKTLTELQQELGLNPEEAKVIQDTAFEPHVVYQNRLRKYKSDFEETIQRGFPIGARTEEDLKQRQVELGIRVEDAERIEGPIRAAAQNEYLADAQKKLEEKQAAAQQYKTKVEGFLSDGEISPLEQKILAELQQEMGLNPADAKDILDTAYKPWVDYQDRLRRYRSELEETIQRGYPVSARTKGHLKQRRVELGIKVNDAKRIEGPILAAAQRDHLARRGDGAAKPHTASQSQQQHTAAAETQPKDGETVLETHPGSISADRRDGEPEVGTTSTKIEQIILKWSVLAGVADVNPIIGADIAGVTACQLKMFYELAEQYEVPVTKERFMELLGTIAAGAGGWGLTIFGATKMIKLVPGVGNALLYWQPPMIAAFTWAMGQVLKTYFPLIKDGKTWDKKEMAQAMKESWRKAKEVDWKAAIKQSGPFRS